jgi:hypothetical protein
MAPELSRPLHRLTPLRDDPAAVWLSRGQRLTIALLGWRKWATYVFGLWLFRLIVALVLIQVVYFPGYLPWIVTVTLAGATVNAMRRSVLRHQSRRMSELLQTSPPPEALKIDEWAQLDAAPDGRMVSLVGWVRGRAKLSVAGESCLGLALPCQQKYPGVLESLHDFDLVDEEEHPLPIKVTDGRLFGLPNLSLSDGNHRRMLVASLDLPVGAVLAGWDTYVLRDGDPVMIIGFKQTLADPNQHGARQVPLQVSIASGPNRPLLIFPLNAERRPAPASPVTPPASFNWG